MPIRVALDAMGGDFAPTETIRGAVESATPDLEVVLFGDPQRLQEVLSSLPANPAVSVVPTSQEVTMHDHPVEAFRKKPDSSLRRAVEAVRAGDVQAMVSAGNTGAAMTAALLTLGAVTGVERPAIATTLPTMKGWSLLLDAGANVDCDANNLYQFALMGSTFVRGAWDVENPRVGLLNIGEEASKGNSLTKQAYEKLKQSTMQFVGNVEARDLFHDRADVVVCDGFVGNVLLKSGEGVAEMIGAALLALGPELGEDVVKLVLHRLRRKMDYTVYGGAPLLGVNGICLIAHGRSTASAIASALRAAEHAVTSGVLPQIQERIKTHRPGGA